MPRKSLEAKVAGAIAPDGTQAAPVAPPEWLEADAATVWHETLRDVPLEHLRAADLQLLPSFCRLVVYERKLWTIHQEREAKKDPIDTDLMDEIRNTSKACYMLATKMRLVASANSRIETGSNRRRTLERGSRPWLAS